MTSMPTRRDFLLWIGRGTGAAAIGAIGVRVLRGGNDDAEFTQPSHGYGWQIDPAKCTFCGRCETACTRHPSAVRAVNDQKKCSNCVVCYGHIRNRTLPSDRIASDGERVCPHDAVVRTPLSGGLDGAFVYTITAERCHGCARCALECNRHGTKSMFLIIRPDLCLQCNDCSIAHVCTPKAVERIPAFRVDDFRGERIETGERHTDGVSP